MASWASGYERKSCCDAWELMEEDHYPGSWRPPGYGKDQGQTERKSVVATNWQAGRRSDPYMPPVSACRTQSQTWAHQIKPDAWRSLARDLNWPSWNIKRRTPPRGGRLLFSLDRNYTTEENKCQPCSEKLGSHLCNTWSSPNHL